MFETLLTLFNSTGAMTVNVIETIFIVVTLWLVRRLILRVVYRRTDDTNVIYTWRKSTEVTFLMLGIVGVLAVWLDSTGMRSITTYIALLSAGIAIALQDPLSNLTGWLFIVTQRPFEVGDRIEIGAMAGDVIDIRFFQFSMLEIGNWVNAEQGTGRVLLVPNKMVFSHSVANYNYGIPFIWNEIPVEVTFESDWRVAKQLLQDIAAQFSLSPSDDEAAEIKRHAKKWNIRPPQMTPYIYTQVAASGVILTLRYLCRPRQRRNSQQKIWEAILDAFAEREDVDFAYPTQRIFYHPHEGKTLLTDHSEVTHPRSPLSSPLE